MNTISRCRIGTTETLCLWLASLFVITTAHAATPWNTIVTDQKSTATKLALTDLQRYLSEVVGHVPDLAAPSQWQQNREPAVLVVSPGTASRLTGIPVEETKLDSEGFYLSNVPVKNGCAVVVSAKTDRGMVQGVYGLLRELGYGFYLGSEAIPESLPDKLHNTPILRNPAFSVRGVLPWYNFFNSPTTWEPIDHRAFIDQLVRMGGNFIGFHTYDNEPFAAVEVNGTMQHGHRLLNTATSTWGTHPTPTSQFAFGIDQLYADEYFGAETTRIENPNEAIRIEQNILRDALAYARDRGMHTCVGFEMTGNPLEPQTRDIFLTRLNHVLEQYPAIDYIWLWQPEMMGATGFVPKALDDPLMDYSLARNEVFRRVVEREDGWGAEPFFQNNATGKQARANEGARLEQFAMLAVHALKHRKDAPRLVLSGWGGDQRLLSAEYYEGLDQLLEPQVVFSSLDTIKGWQGGHVPFRDRVDSAYHDLPPSRQRWPIIWLEGDGDLWHPQPGVYQYCRGAARDILAGGSQGFLAIHWRTREAEVCYAYMMQFAWDPQLTADAFFADRARRCYDPIAVEIEPILIKLDKLFYRWVGGEGQPECGQFRWDAGQQEKVDQLKRLRRELAQLLPRSGSARPRVQWLLHRMDWVLTFREVQANAIEADRLLVKAYQSDRPEARRLARLALDMLDGKTFSDAMHHYVRRISTRGEYGVLATINTKAIFDWRKLRSQAQSILQQEQPEPCRIWQPQPEVIVPRFHGSLAAGSDLTFECLVLGGERAYLHYRPLGATQWQTTTLKTDRGWVQNAVIPEKHMQSPGVEMAVSLEPDHDKEPLWGPRSITVMPQTSSQYTSKLITANPVVDADPPKLSRHEKFIFRLNWQPVWQADFYRVYRDNEPWIETAVTDFFDNPPRPNGTYVVEARRDGRKIWQSQPVPYQVPRVALKEAPELHAVVRAAGVLLLWPAEPSPYVSRYELYRRTEGQANWEMLADMPALRKGENRFFDYAQPGTWRYRLVAVSAAGEKSNARQIQVRISGEPASPVVDLPLHEAPEGLHVTGKISFTAQGAHFVDGYFDIPYREKFNADQGMTVEFEVAFDQVDPMTVPLCHGWYSADGWFFQILDGRLTLCHPVRNLKSDTIEPGRWYKVRWIYDGVAMRLWVDDYCVDHTLQPIRIVSSKKPIRVGQYVSPAPSFSFKGTMRNLKMYRDVLPN